MAHGELDSDSQFECPMCGGTLKRIDHQPCQPTGTYELVPYGCANCGYMAMFDEKRLDDFIKRRE